MDSLVSPNGSVPIKQRTSSKTHSPRWVKGSLDGNRATTGAGAQEPGHAFGTLSSETSSPTTTLNNPSGQTSCLLRPRSEREQSVQLGIRITRQLQLRDIRT